MKKFLIMTVVLVFISTTVGCNCCGRLFRRGARMEPFATNYTPPCCSPCSDGCGPAMVSGTTTQLGPITTGP